MLWRWRGRRALTSCPLPASSSLGTSSPWLLSTRPSLPWHRCRSARRQAIVSNCHFISHTCLPLYSRIVRRQRARCCSAMEGRRRVKVARRTKASRAPRLGAIPHRDHGRSSLSPSACLVACYPANSCGVSRNMRGIQPAWDRSCGAYRPRLGGYGEQTNGLLC